MEFRLKTFKEVVSEPGVVMCVTVSYEDGGIETFGCGPGDVSHLLKIKDRERKIVSWTQEVKEAKCSGGD